MAKGPKSKPASKKGDPGIEDMTIVRDDRTMAMREVRLKDSMAKCTYELLKGAGGGDTIKREGSKSVHPDLEKAFKVLHVHMAVNMDLFHWAGIEVGDVDKFHDHSLSDRMNVFGIKIAGHDENERVELQGEYNLLSGGWIAVKTPLISLTTSYRFYNELKSAVDNIVHETERYLAGKWHPSVTAEDNQGELEFAEEGDDDSFAEAEQ